MTTGLKHAGAVVEVDRRPRRHRLLWTLVVLAVLVAAVAAYTVWDDRRFVVDTVTISHPQLPAAFDGYRIVQISDLHSARFGDGQADLIAAVSAARPDLILLTGDYTTTAADPGPEELAPLQELVDGLPPGVPVYYILGNWDADGEYGAGPDQDTPLVLALESRGAKPVYPYSAVYRSGEHIWLTDWTQREYRDRKSLEQAMEQAVLWDKHSPARVSALYEAWWARQVAGHDPAKEFDLAVTHRPLDFPDYDAEMARNAAEQERAWEATGGPAAKVDRTVEIDYDVNVSGHTHGGQFRIPLVGAVVSPEGRIFPERRFIEGVRVDARGRVGYISRGLGAGGMVPFLRFRLFDTPELSVIVLKRGPSGGG